MKGVTIIIILSVVWSIVSAIIEKRKAAANKEAIRNDLEGNTPTQKQAPVSVKVQSLRQRKKPIPQKAAVEEPRHEIEPITRLHKPIARLHKEDCPLPPQTSRQSTPKAATQFAELLRSRRNIRTAIVLAEILDKPVSQR